EREALGHFEIVLHVGPGDSFPETPVGARSQFWRRKTRIGRGNAAKKAHEVIKCVGPSAVAIAYRVVTEAADVRAHFERMFSRVQGEVVTDLDHIVLIVSRRAGIYSQRTQRSRSPTHAHAQLDGPERLAGNKGQFRRNRLGRKI